MSIKRLAIKYVKKMYCLNLHSSSVFLVWMGILEKKQSWEFEVKDGLLSYL